jgi:hypothetical protein
VLAATPTELAELEPIGSRLFVLRSHVVAALALTALQNNIIAWHYSFPISDCQFSIQLLDELPWVSNRQSAIGNR